MPDPDLHEEQDLHETMPDPDLPVGVTPIDDDDIYDIHEYYYEVPDYDFGLYYGADDAGNTPAEGVDETTDDLNMYWDELQTTTTKGPDIYDYLFGFDIPNRNRNRIKVPVRKKFDAQALKLAYSEMLKNANELQSKRKRRLKRQVDVIGAISNLFFSSKQTKDKAVSVEETLTSRQNDVTLWVQDKVVNKVGGTIYSVINETILVPRDRLSIYRGRPLPKVVGLLVRRPPALFRTSFVRISLGTFNIVSTGTLGKNVFYNALIHIKIKFIVTTKP